MLARTDAVLNALSSATVAWDVHGTVLAWNRSAEEMYGWTRDEVLGRHLAEVLILPEEAESVRSLGRSVEAGTPWDGDLTMVRGDGGTMRVHVHLRPVRNDDGVIVGSVGTADDVTQQRAVEERAADLTNHLLMALAGGELGTWRRDIATGVIEWDAAMDRLYGLEPGEFDGTYEGWIARVHPDDRAETERAIADAVAAGESYGLEYRVVWPDGTVRWLQGRAMIRFGADGAVAGTIGCSGDVTDRKLTELENARRAVEAERLVEEGNLQRRRLEFLASLNEAALRATDHRDLMRSVTAAAVPELGDWCTIHFFDQVGSLDPEVILAHFDPDKVAWIHDLMVKSPYNPNGPIGASLVVRTGTTQFVPEFGDEFIEEAIAGGFRGMTPDQLRSIVEGLNLTSLIAVPLITKRGVIGAMQFVSAESGRIYGSEDVSLAETAASRIAEALDNAWLRDQQREVATILQSALLPHRLPQINGVSVAVRYWAAGAASEVGGDFYDLFRIPPRPGQSDAPERWAVVIGDVCGTGPEAAAVTALARHTIRAAATHGASPVEVLEWLNSAMLASDSDRFCTVCYCTLERVDAAAWRFTSVAGGHPLPLMARRNAPAHQLGSPGTLLGVLPRLKLSPSVVDLVVGDTVVLHTDGVTDVPAPYGIDEAAMSELVGEATGVDGRAERVAERLGLAVQKVLPVPQRDDDIALVVLRITGDSIDGAGGGDDASANAGEPAEVAVLGERSFDRTPGSVAVAREYVVSTVAMPMFDDSLRLAVSELATNAVIHARSDFRIRVSAAGTGIRVEIQDDSERLPIRNHQPFNAVSGRGIGIVDHVAARWGVTPMVGGKSVWFELQL